MNPESQAERRRKVLTDADIEAIKGIACQCPHGMTQEDVYELRAFLRWWKELKETVGGVVIKAIIWLIVGLAAVVALVTKPWSP